MSSEGRRRTAMLESILRTERTPQIIQVSPKSRRAQMETNGRASWDEFKLRAKDKVHRKLVSGSVDLCIPYWDDD